MLGVYMLADEATIERLSNDEDLFEAVEEYGDESTTIAYDIDKLWDGLHFLLTGVSAQETIENDLFTRALWNDINQLEKSPVGLNQLIAAWCEMHGIGLDRVETVRQRYYRIRKAYYKHGINLKKSSRQHNHDSVDFQVSETESNNHTQQ